MVRSFFSDIDKTRLKPKLIFLFARALRTIKKTLDGKIRREEGVWLSPKHIIANFFQWLLPITFIYLTVILLSLINESDDDWLQKNQYVVISCNVEGLNKTHSCVF